MVESMGQRIENAKGQVASLQAEIGEILSSKKGGKSLSQSVTTALAPIRAPPQVKCRRTLKGHFGKITAIHWGPDSTKIISASQDGNLLLWNAVTSNKLQAIPLKSSYVMSVGMEQSSGNMVACGGLDNLCTVYKLNSPSAGMAIEMASHDGFISCCRFLSKEHILTSSGDSTCIRWDIASGRVLDTFAEHQADAMFLSVKPDDPNVFVSCSVDKTIKVWDIRDSQQSMQTFTGHMGDINGVDFMPSDGNAFATCSDDGTCRLWDLRAYQELAKFGKLQANQDTALPPIDGFTSIAFGKSGRLIFCGRSDAKVLAYDVLGGKATPAFTLQGHESHVSCLGVSPNGEALCTGSWDESIKVRRT